MISSGTRSHLVTVVGIVTSIACAASASAQTVNMTPRWSHQSGSENWVAREVSLGNEGTEVFTQLDVFGLARRLFTEGASGSSPLWQSTDSQPTFYQHVASSADASLHVSARDEVAGNGQHQIKLRTYVSGSSTPAWTWGSPASLYAYTTFDVLVTRAGDRVVLVNYVGAVGRSEVRTFSATSAVPLSTWTVDTYGPSIGARLSRDGATLYVGSPMAANIVDMATGIVVHRTTIVGQATGGNALSGDGNTFAVGMTGGFRVFHRNSQGQWASAYDRVLPQGSTCDELAISEDGSRLAVSYALHSGTYAVTIELHDLPASLQQSAANVLWTRIVDSAGAYQNRASDLILSADGRTLAAGFWGDNGGPTPEILVFENDASVPAYRCDLPGSVQKLALSTDGRRLASASKARHNTVFSGDGEVDYFEVGAQDMSVQGVPHAGGSVVIGAQTTPNRPVLLVSAAHKALVPTPFGSMGLLYLDRTTILGTLPMGTSNAQGHCHVTWSLAGAPIGTSVYFQGLALSPRRLTLDWCKVTVVP